MENSDTAGWKSLRGGVTEDLLREAIEKSGYPLQVAVFELMERNFKIQPEWGFRDRLTGEMRAIDMLAELPLNHLPSEESRVRPSLAILIECKQSEMPYVFFAPAPSRDFANLPRVCGLGVKEVVVTTDDDPSRWHLPFMRALGLERDEFIIDMPVHCILSRAARKSGPKLELSGTDAYNGIVMPLMSAAAHFASATAPPSTAFWFDAYLLCAVAVVDAPLVQVSVHSDGTEMELVPWGRLLRHEPVEGGGFGAHVGESSVIDVVHRDYFPKYLEDHLLPFAQRFSERALANHHVLATGQAFAEGFREDSWTDIEQRLRALDEKSAPERGGKPANWHPSAGGEEP